MPDASQFAAEIRRQGYRMTPQRQLVLEAVRALAGHATPGEIYDWVQQQAPAINRATVYRVLGFLCELQLVARFDVAGTTTYELVGPQPHHHLVCRACGGIAHVADEVLDGPQSRVLDQAENRLHVQKATLCHAMGVEP